MSTGAAKRNWSCQKQVDLRTSSSWGRATTPCSASNAHYMRDHQCLCTLSSSYLREWMWSLCGFAYSIVSGLQILLRRTCTCAVLFMYNHPAQWLHVCWFYRHHILMVRPSRISIRLIGRSVIYFYNKAISTWGQGQEYVSNLKKSPPKLLSESVDAPSNWFWNLACRRRCRRRSK